jgi:hypothetical protein
MSAVPVAAAAAVEAIVVAVRAAAEVLAEEVLLAPASPVPALAWPVRVPVPALEAVERVVPERCIIPARSVPKARRTKMRKNKIKIVFSFFLLFLLAVISGCIGQSDAYDTNTELAKGEPPFPPQKVYGIVDPYHYLSAETAQSCFSVIDGLKKDGIAEITVLIQKGVKMPEEYATKYGRYIGLGEKEKNNGLVWLIRPDVRPEQFRLTYSVGRGLPKLTSSDLGPIMEKASGPINADNYDLGVARLIEGTEIKLREIYKGVDKK